MTQDLMTTDQYAIQRVESRTRRTPTNSTFPSARPWRDKVWAISRKKVKCCNKTRDIPGEGVSASTSPRRGEVGRRPGEGVSARFTWPRRGEVGRRPGEGVSARFTSPQRGEVGRRPGEGAEFTSPEVGRRPGEGAEFTSPQRNLDI
jgi:hypothetical protein